MLKATTRRLSKIMKYLSGVNSFIRVKAERIFALRRQYDAFLEEDKKRKERNEYILNKFDNMRMSTAIVLRGMMPVQYLSGLQKNIHHETETTKPVQNPFQISRKFEPSLDEEIIIREMSKKYILIPKQNVEDKVLMNASVSKEEAVYDWRTKYEILDQINLNKNDSGIELPIPKLEEAATTVQPILNDQRDTTSNENFQLRDIYPQLKGDKNQGNQNYTPEAEKPLLEFENGQITNSKVHAKISNVITGKTPIEQNVASFSGESLMSHENIDSVQISYPYKNMTSDVIYANVKINKNRSTSNDSVHQKDDQQITETFAYQTHVKEKIPDNEVLTKITAIRDVHQEYIDPKSALAEPYTDKTELVDNANTHQLRDKIESNVSDNFSTQGHIEDKQYPMEIINTVEFTPDPDVNIEQGVNVNPPGYEQAHVAVDEGQSGYQNIFEHLDDPAVAEQNNEQHALDIREFEQENDEMFVNQTYENPEELPQSTEEAYNSEYQEQGDQYVYYEQEHVDPLNVEILENNADMQPYDQAYQQQYTEDNVYVQPTYDTTDQQEINENPEHQQMYEHPEEQQIYGNPEQQEIYGYPEEQQFYENPEQQIYENVGQYQGESGDDQVNADQQQYIQSEPKENASQKEDVKDSFKSLEQATNESKIEVVVE